MKKILKYYFLFSISILFTQEINDIKSVIIAENLNRPVFAVFEPETNKMYAVEQTGNSVFKEMSATKCTEYKDRVAKYCGQMVDCV